MFALALPTPAAAEPAVHDALMESYGRCLSNPAFLDTIVDRLAAGRIGNYPALAPGETRSLLRRALSSAILAARGSASGAAMLEGIAGQHARAGAATLPPAAHAAWSWAVLAAVAQHDPRWSGELERDWRALLARVVARFAAAY